MSEPETTPAAPEPVDRASLPRPKARAADRIGAVSALLIAVAAGGAISAAAPAILHARMGGDRGEDPPPATRPLDLAHRPPEPLADPDPLFDPDRDGDDEAPPPSPADVLGGERPRIGLARSALSLREQPGASAKSIGEVKPGELVMILHESGDWVQVYAPGHADGTMIMGWATKSGIAVR